MDKYQLAVLQVALYLRDTAKNNSDPKVQRVLRELAAIIRARLDLD